MLLSADEDDYCEFYLLGVSGRFEKAQVATQTFVIQAVMTADPLQSRDVFVALFHFQKGFADSILQHCIFSGYAILTNNIYCSDFLRS